MTGSDDIRVALIGYGLGGEVFHAPLIHVTEGMRLTSIVTVDPERRQRASRRYPDARILDRNDSSWAAPEGHDLVVVCTPNRYHVPLALTAIEAGLPVVVDKPLAPTSSEGEKLVAAADEKGVFLSVFQNRRWDGDFLTVKKLLTEGVLGPVVRFESRFERWRPELRPDAWRELGSPEEGGGLLFDLGSHLVDQAVSLFGPPTSVYAELDRRRRGAEIDDDSFVALTHPNGEHSHLWMSVVARLLGPRLRVIGLEGAYEKHGLDPQEDALASGRTPVSEDWGREPPDQWGVLATDDERPIETEPGRYQDYYAGVAESLRTGTAPPVDARDSLVVLRILESAIRSAASGAVEYQTENK
jgi:predicted dehydrogenase